MRAPCAVRLRSVRPLPRRPHPGTPGRLWRGRWPSHSDPRDSSSPMASGPSGSTAISRRPKRRISRSNQGSRRQISPPPAPHERPAEIRPGRSDRDSSPCPTPPQSPAQTSAAHRHRRRLPRWRGVGSSNRRRGQRRCRSTCARPSRGRVPRRHACMWRTPATPMFMSSRFIKKSLVSVSGRWVKTPSADRPTFAFRARRPPTSTVISGAVSVSMCARSTSNSSAGLRCPFAR